MRKGHGYDSSLITERAREHAKSHQNQRNQGRRQKKEEDFFAKSFSIRDYVFSPQGFEGPMMVVYTAAIPYLAGVAFLFLYVAESQFEFFVEFSLTSVFVIWAIGYEVCAALLIAGISLAWIKHRSSRRKRAE
ncbi:MAG: hypothetical protein JXK04_03815 [Campylobacterales bacterium]|nr:hypothetical protein [Campylobacterales bacterium]